MEMNGHAKCDLNHFGYALQASDVHRKSLLFINVSFSPLSLLLFAEKVDYSVQGDMITAVIPTAQ